MRTRPIPGGVLILNDPRARTRRRGRCAGGATSRPAWRPAVRCWQWRAWRISPLGTCVIWVRGVSRGLLTAAAAVVAAAAAAAAAVVAVVAMVGQVMAAEAEAGAGAGTGAQAQARARAWSRSPPLRWRGGRRLPPGAAAGAGGAGLVCTKAVAGVIASERRGHHQRLVAAAAAGGSRRRQRRRRVQWRGCSGACGSLRQQPSRASRAPTRCWTG
jgi:hypothetical protein